MDLICGKYTNQKGCLTGCQSEKGTPWVPRCPPEVEERGHRENFPVFHGTNVVLLFKFEGKVGHADGTNAMKYKP